jgi:hypothetical protein
LQNFGVDFALTKHRFILAKSTRPAPGPRLPITEIKTMTRQLGEASAPSLDFYRDGRQRWRHTATIREHYGFRDLEEDKAAGFGGY